MAFKVIDEMTELALPGSGHCAGAAEGVYCECVYGALQGYLSIYLSTSEHLKLSHW